MDLILFTGVLLFPFIPYIVKGKFEFIDIILLFYLYVDITVLYVSQFVNYIYLVNAIVLLYSLKYFFIDNRAYIAYFKSVKNVAYMFLGAFLLFPFFQGINLDKSTRFFSMTFVSIILLPMAIHYYSTRGDIKKLLHFGHYFFIAWCLFILYATVNKLGGFDSERIGGTLFYYGKVAARGGLTYISFALLLVPLMMKYLKKRERIVQIVCAGFVFAALLAALKRFVFVVIALGLLNYLIKRKLKMRVKVGLIAGVGALVIFLLSGVGMKETVNERFESRGGENKFSMEAVESDIRIDEPLIVLDYMWKQSDSFGFLIGIKTDLRIKVHDPRVFNKRTIHNEYAMLFMKFGLIGVILYIMIFVILYRKAAKLKKYLVKRRVDIMEYWIVFQNLVLIFLIEGMVGGHSHPTFRGLVMLYAGAIAGYLYKLAQGNQNKNV